MLQTTFILPLILLYDTNHKMILRKTTNILNIDKNLLKANYYA